MRTFGYDIPPRLSWLGGKTFPQGNGGRKNRSGYKQEHMAALVDDAVFVATKLAETPAVVDALAEQGLEIQVPVVGEGVIHPLQEI